MKAFVFVLSTLAVSALALPLTDVQKEKLSKAHNECLKSSGVDEATVEQSRRGVYVNNPVFKNYLYCVSQNIGFQDATGALQTEIIETKVGSLLDNQTALAKVLEECAVQRNEPQETAFEFAKCLRRQAPGLELFKGAPVYLSNEKTQELFNTHKACASKDDLGEETIEEARKQGVLFLDEKFKNYIYCFTKSRGFFGDDDTVNKDVFVKIFGKVIKDDVQVEQLAEKCIRKKESPQDTAFYLSKCINENSPVHVEFFPREIPVPKAIAKEIVQHNRKCLKKTGVDRELLAKSRQGVFSEDPAYKQFTLCMFQEAGFINEAGEYDLEVVKETTLKLFTDPVVVDQLITDCAVKKTTLEDTAYFAQVCFYKNAPGHLSISQFGAISEEKKVKQDKILKECAQETAVPQDVVLNARRGDFKDDPLLKEYFFCIQKTTGILSETGAYNEDVIKKFLNKSYDAEEASYLFDKCARSAFRPLDTAFESFKCFYNEAPEITIF